MSLATALKDMPAAGKSAVGLFIASLGVNLISYVTAQFDMRARLACLREGREEGIEGNNWTRTTTFLNVIAGMTFIAGAVFLAFFVGRSA